MKGVAKAFPSSAKMSKVTFPNVPNNNNGFSSPVIVTCPNQLRKLLDQVFSSYQRCSRTLTQPDASWAKFLNTRAYHDACSGKWILYHDDTNAVTSVVNLAQKEFEGKGDESLWRLQLISFAADCNDGDERGEGIARQSAIASASSVVAREAADLIERSVCPRKTGVVKVTFGALERSLIPAVKCALETSGLGLRYDWESPCTLYMHSLDPSLSKVVPHFSARVRRLQESDAELIDSRWAYRSKTSISMIREMIRKDESGCCLGIELDGTLRGWILQYLTGDLGMLWCEEEFRGRGFAQALLARAVGAVGNASKNIEENIPLAAFAQIVKGNEASEKLFLKMGWQVVGAADWVGFSSSVALTESSERPLMCSS